MEILEISNDNSSPAFPEKENKIEERSTAEVVLETVDITPEKSGGVLKQVIKEGESNEFPSYGDKVSVHYTGWLLNNKDKPILFENSRKGERCEFNLGRGLVIKGWDLGVSTMKKGEIALFIIQPQYAYGEFGYPPTIPPYTPLLFEIELFEWKLEDLSPKKDNGILRKVIEKGEGTVIPNEGSQIRIKLIGYHKDQPFENEEKSFILGEGPIQNIPEGVEIAISKFHLKEKSLIYLKSKYAFDTKEVPDLGIPSNADLKYEITLLDFERVKDVWEMNSDEKLEKAKVSKMKGLSFYQMGHFKVAAKQFKFILSCLENDPGAPADTENKSIRMTLLLSGYLNLALCYIKLENFLDAIKVCDKALEMDPENEKALYRRGQSKMSINDCQEALQDFEKLCTISPSNKAAKNSLISCQRKIQVQNQKDKIIYSKMFEKLTRQDMGRLRNFDTETGVWVNGKGNKEEREKRMTEAEMFLKCGNSTLEAANVIEISNTAK